MFENIKIILVETSHSGNIGSAARAMKTMGLCKLCLVNPQQSIDEKSHALAAGAEDLLDNAQVFSELTEAIGDCDVVFGTSVRKRHLNIRHLICRDACLEVIQQARSNKKIAVVFGRERTGLTNDELLKCNYHLAIPSNPEYGSLNLAMAVQIICYELRMASLTDTAFPTNTSFSAPAKHKELEYYLNETEHVFTELNFISSPMVMKKLRQLYLRTEIKRDELNILQGMLSTVKKLKSQD